MCEGGIGNEGVADRIGKLGGLDLEVEAIGSQWIRRGGKPVQNVQENESGEALPAWRNLVEIDAAIAGTDRVDIVGPELGKVGERMGAALRIEEADEIAGDIALIEGIPPLFGENAQGFGENGKAHPLARKRCPTVEQKLLAGAGIMLQLLAVLGPVGCGALVDHEPVLGKIDGGFENIGEGTCAVIGQKPPPGIDRAGHGDGVDRVGGKGGDPLIKQALIGEAGGRPARAIIAVKFLLVGAPIEGEAIAANAGIVRLDHALRGGGGEGGIHGIAARPQNLDGEHGGELLRGGGGTLATIGNRTTRKMQISHQYPPATYLSNETDGSD